VLLAKEGTVLKGTIDRLIKGGRYCGREAKVKKLSNDNLKANIPI